MADVRIGWVSLQLPGDVRELRVSWSALLLPEPSGAGGPERTLTVSWAALTLPASSVVRPAFVSWASLQLPGPATPSGPEITALDERSYVFDLVDRFASFYGGVVEGSVVETAESSAWAARGTITEAGYLQDTLDAEVFTQGVKQGRRDETARIYDSPSAQAVYSEYNYPAFAQWEGTRLVPRTGVKERLARNGRYRTRTAQIATKFDPIIVHSFLNRAERQQLLDFYVANRSRSFHFTAYADNVARTCMFAGTDPLRIDMLPEFPGYYRATVQLREA